MASGPLPTSTNPPPTVFVITLCGHHSNFATSTSETGASPENDSATIRVQTVTPSIDDFRAVSTRVVQGSPVVLSWRTRNISKIHIDPGNYEDIRATGTVTVNPLQNTTFRLTAYGAASMASSSPVVVDVVPGRRRAAGHR